MARVIAGMTISLDGFVADAEGKVDRLYADLAALRPDAGDGGLHRRDRRRPHG